MSDTAVPAQSFSDFEKAAHGRMANSYYKWFCPVSVEAIEPLLDAAQVGNGSNVLDVATGPGELAARASRRGATTVGVDISPQMVDLARRLHPGVEFRAGGAEALPVGSGEFDAVVCAFGLGHFFDPEAALREMVRALRTGGIVAIAWWQELSRNRINGIFFDAIRKLQVPTSALPPGPPIDRYSDPAKLEELLTSSGLENVRVASLTSTYNVTDVNDLWTLALGSFARVSTILLAQDEAGQKSIRAAVEQEAAPYRIAGHLEIPIAFYVAHGTRVSTAAGFQASGAE